MIVDMRPAVELHTPPMDDCPHRKTISNSPSRSLNPTASHFLIKVRGETRMEQRGDVSFYRTVFEGIMGVACLCDRFFFFARLKIPKYRVGFLLNVHVHVLQQRHKKWQTERLQGPHRNTSHKPYHDVRRQLCTQSVFFFSPVLPWGHPDRHDPQ